MKIKTVYVVFLLCLLVISGCESTKVQESQNTNNFRLPKDSPSFVTEKDFEKADWDIFVYKTLSLFKISKDIIYHVLNYQLKYIKKNSKQWYLKQNPLGIYTNSFGRHHETITTWPSV
ncbi:hypothetical protein [Bacillus pseudomycoides]|uniref:hypothetical protein n=1 Tax=Bacillus pseudomycoides TaxID=64104 RepID=UPI0011434F34|nr:hypothetical protein [Bacillus pseudomycoides]